MIVHFSQSNTFSQDRIFSVRIVHLKSWLYFTIHNHIFYHLIGTLIGFVLINWYYFSFQSQNLQIYLTCFQSVFMFPIYVPSLDMANKMDIVKYYNVCIHGSTPIMVRLLMRLNLTNMASHLVRRVDSWWDRRTLGEIFGLLVRWPYTWWDDHTLGEILSRQDN